MKTEEEKRETEDEKTKRETEGEEKMESKTEEEGKNFIHSSSNNGHKYHVTSRPSSASRNQSIQNVICSSQSSSLETRVEVIGTDI